MPLSNFSRIAGEQNTVGYAEFYFIPYSNLIANPLVYNGKVVGNLSTVGDWYKGYGVHTDLNLGDSLSITSAGGLWNVNLTGIMPVCKPETQSLFDELSRTEVLVLVLDKNKRLRLLGDINYRLRFTYELAGSGYNFAFTGQLAAPAPYYEGSYYAADMYWQAQPEYLSVLARAAQLGIDIPSNKVQYRQNRLIKLLKEIGIWFSLEGFWLYRNDGGYLFSLINMKNPTQTYSISFVNPLVWTANDGLASDGTASISISGINPALHFLNINRNFAHLACWELTNVAAASGIGFDTGTNSMTLAGRTATDRLHMRLNNSTADTIPVTSSVGFQLITRNNGGEFKAFFPQQNIDDTVTRPTSGIVSGSFSIFKSGGNAAAARKYGMVAVGGAVNNSYNEYYQIIAEYINSF